MMIQVFNETDKEILLSKGFRFICEQKIGNEKTYIFEYNKLNFDIGEIKHRVTNKLYF